QEELAVEEVVAQRQAVDDGRFDKRAVRQRLVARTATTDPDRTLLRLGNRFLEAGNGTLVDHRTHERRAVNRVADNQFLRPGHQLVHKLVVDLAGHVGTRAGRTLLAGEAE